MLTSTIRYTCNHEHLSLCMYALLLLTHEREVIKHVHVACACLVKQYMRINHGRIGASSCAFATLHSQGIHIDAAQVVSHALATC